MSQSILLSVMKRFAALLTLALLGSCATGTAGAGTSVSITPVTSGYGSRALEVLTDCADPTVDTPYTDEFAPGGPTFDVLAEVPGTYTVLCNGQVLARKVVS